MRSLVLLGFLFVVALLPSAAFSQKSKPAAANQKSAYRPGLGELMLLTQARHLKLWLAGSAGNWDLADYQVDELKEGLEDAGKLIPVYKGMPIGPMIESTVMSPIEDLEKAIKAKDGNAFEKSFASLTESCNVCHQSANRRFIVIQQPRSEHFPNQNFTTSR